LCLDGRPLADGGESGGGDFALAGETNGEVLVALAGGPQLVVREVLVALGYIYRLVLPVHHVALESYRLLRTKTLSRVFFWILFALRAFRPLLLLLSPLPMII